MLDGKIDSNRFKVIASRFTSVAKPADASHDAEEPTLGASTLQDLMLQAEILVQYGMRNKAVERLQRIQELFPREEERNEDLQRLYLAAGVTPRYAGPAPLPPEAAAVPLSGGGPGAAEASSTHAQGVADVRSFTRVAEITRKLYNQSTATAVLTTAVNEIGRHWELARCVAAMRKPGLPPTAVQQSCADGLKAASSAVLAEVICCLYDATVGHEPITIHDAQKAAELQPVRKAIAELGATSVLAIPLKDGEESVGLLLLMHNKHSQWQPNDVVVLRTLGEQMVTALNNAGLRRLVKNLSVTDEKSGLLKRASYIDLLLAESKRALQNASPLSLLLLQFGKSAAMVKEHGDAAVESAMEKIGKLAAGNIRSNDLAFRYDTTTIAIILGDTAEKEGMMAVEKLRKLIAEVKLTTKDGAEKGQPLPFSGGLAEAVVRENYDPVDIVTEVINRAEHALAVALTQGPGKVTALGAALAAGAVA
jgi:GGDEF domain-containing protein